MNSRGEVPQAGIFFSGKNSHRHKSFEAQRVLQARADAMHGAAADAKEVRDHISCKC